MTTRLFDPGTGGSAGRCAGFTLTELMVSMMLFSLVIIGGLYSHIFGLKMSAFTQAKLRATHNARAALNYTRAEIREATTLQVGNGNANGFTNVAANSAQQGNALQIWPTVNTNNFVRYFVDSKDKALKRQASGTTNVQVIANYITNQIVFRAEDFVGNVLTNSQDNRVIRIRLDFYQWEFAVLQSGAGDFYDYYRLQTKVARRQ
jgi:prepilin-type N-terminal cleavage/methylation domain-containing protein